MGMNPDGTRAGRPVAGHESPQPMDVPQAPRIYHVWVNLSNLTTHVGVEYPGLVLGWRRGVDGYEAQVIWVTPQHDRGTDASHIGWVAAHRLKPRE